MDTGRVSNRWISTAWHAQAVGGCSGFIHCRGWTELAGQIKTLVTDYKASKDESQKSELKLRLTKSVDHMFLVRLRIQGLELARMRLKLSATESMLEVRVGQRAGLVRQRVESLVE